IDVLNADYGHENSELSNSNVYLGGYSYGSVANCAVVFVVTNVVRISTTVASFGSNDAVKKSSQGGQDPTNPTTKLNMWVCDLGSGLLGYAQFPGGSSATDGVVIDYQAFGTSASYPMYAEYNLGRSATHEVGHWINLRHIWGDRRCGDDYVGDTPQHDGANYGCPANNLRSACKGKPLEQWMNYMDYTDDRCMYMFSGLQKSRMDAAIENARSAYFNVTSPAAQL
ncbi:MAG: M43 family zinc metalloprotease, partial [Ferruginibacter sp.]